MKKKASLKDWIMLEAVFLLYSMTSVLSKFASASEPLSMKFILFYVLIVGILGVYALLWQQVIKNFELSVAYANKAVCLAWALVWSLVIFHDRIRISHVIGIIVVMAGIFLLNTGTSSGEGKSGRKEDEK